MTSKSNPLAAHLNAAGNLADEIYQHARDRVLELDAEENLEVPLIVAYMDIYREALFRSRPGAIERFLIEADSVDRSRLFR